MFERMVRTEEVVVGDEQGGQGDCAAGGFETAGGAGVEFVGTVEPFDEFFERAEFFRFGIEVLQADDLFMRDFEVLTGLVQEADAGGIRRIAVGDERRVLVCGSGTQGFLHSDGRRQGIARGIDMVGGDVASARRNEEEDVSVFAGDFDVGFVAGLSGVDRAFEPHIEAVAVRSGRKGIVEDGLIRDGDLEDVSENISRFASRDAQGDVKG